MATIIVPEIVKRAETILNDVGGVRWTRGEILVWINDSYRQIGRARPDSCATSRYVRLATGTRQKLALLNLQEAFLLIDITRNVSGNSGGQIITRIDGQVLNTMVPDWHIHQQSIDIMFWVYDERNPKEFLVYPPALATAEVELIVAILPLPHNLTDQELDYDDPPGVPEYIRLDDVFADAMLSWVLYRAFSKDADTANANVAAHHLEMFRLQLGITPQGGK